MFHRLVFSRSVVRPASPLIRFGIISRSSTLSPFSFVSNGTKGKLYFRTENKFIANLGNHKIKIKTKLQSVKSFSKENILTFPNAISFSRLLTTPVLGYLIIYNNYAIAAVTFSILCFSDLVDGYIARNVKGQSSILGSIIDPLADKLMIGTATVTLGIVGILPLPLVFLFVLRDVGLVLFSFYLRYISLPPPISLYQYCNLKLKSVQATPSNVSKVNTVLQALLISTSLLAHVFDFASSSVLPFLWYLTGTTTVWSSVDYFWFKSGYRIIRKQRKSKNE